MRALLSTPSARGLFRRAITQSAGYEPYAVVPSPSYQRIVEASNKLYDSLGSQDINVLRQASAEQVLGVVQCCLEVLLQLARFIRPQTSFGIRLLMVR